MQPPLIQLGYISKSTQLMSDQQLDRLLVSARTRNEQNDITGMLLYADGSFLQVLEGAAVNIHEIFAIIKADSQHHKINVLFEEDLPSRHFRNWTMGFHRLQSAEIIQSPGMNNFLQGEEDLSDFLLEQAKPANLLQSMLTYFRQAA